MTVADPSLVCAAEQVERGRRRPGCMADALGAERQADMRPDWPCEIHELVCSCAGARARGMRRVAFICWLFRTQRLAAAEE